jgi:hypothetical protein
MNLTLPEIKRDAVKSFHAGKALSDFSHLQERRNHDVLLTETEN